MRGTTLGIGRAVPSNFGGSVVLMSTVKRSSGGGCTVLGWQTVPPRGSARGGLQFCQNCNDEGTIVEAEPAG